MNLPIILTITIGLIFIYLALSILVSGIQEMVTMFLEWRASTLKESIVNLLEKNEREHEITDTLYQVSLIKSLNQEGKSLSSWFKGLFSKASSIGPSYIPSKLFSLSLLELLREKYNLEFNDFEDIEDIIRKLENPDIKLPEQLKQNLIILARQARYRVKSAEFKIKNFEKEIAYWFDESMNRASGVYTRNAKGFALLIGFLIAVCANADTLNMVNRLNTEPILRSAVNDVAQKVVEEKENCNDRQCLEELGLDKALSLPLGWDFSSSRYPKLHQQQSNIVLVILGWIFTAIALSMGAPFWFDVLNRFVNVRNTGKKPKTMVEEEDEE